MRKGWADSLSLAVARATGKRQRAWIYAVQMRCYGGVSGEKLPAQLSEANISAIPFDRTRNFSVIAHIDHGKSSLSDRMLEFAGNVTLNASHRQLLDDLKVERERGITIKARTASMVYDGYLLNLIDTPGHVDFEYEVKRSIASCEGALLLVDSTQGIQAQTLANYNLAKSVGLKILPVLTKLDLQHSDPEMCLDQIERVLKIPNDDVVWTSAKTGEGCSDLFPAIVKKFPPPKRAPASIVAGAKYRGVIVDSWYDQHQGTICLVLLDHGEIQAGDNLHTASSLLSSGGNRPFTVREVGQLLPHPVMRNRLCAGQLGYVIGGIKERNETTVGDFVSDRVETVRESSGETKTSQSMSSPKVFASVFPVDSADFDELRKSIERLSLNDSSVALKQEMSGALGAGYRCGFLGQLHMEVFIQRLRDEFETEIIATAPSVPYWAKMKDGSTILADSPAHLPELSSGKVVHYKEPMATVTLLTPTEYMGPMLTIFKDRRARQLDITHLDETKVFMKFIMPFQEVIIDLHDEVKTKSSGFASFEYEQAEPEESNVNKVEMLINGKEVDALTFVCHNSVSHKRGREVATKLKKVIKRQQFEIIIQAAVGSKVVARERIPPFRKDVLTKSGKTVGGGDITRKRKLLERQKEGKKRMKTVGNVELDQKAFFAVLSKD